MRASAEGSGGCYPADWLEESEEEWQARRQARDVVLEQVDKEAAAAAAASAEGVYRSAARNALANKWAPVRARESEPTPVAR